MRRKSTSEWLDYFHEKLASHQSWIENDPQSNPIRLLAYDISKYIETRELAFRDIEEIIKILSDEGAIARAMRLRERAAVDQIKSLKKSIEGLAKSKADEGFNKFKAWAEKAGQGIVLTAHPTFSLSPEIRDVLGQIATSGKTKDEGEALKALPYLPKRAPTLAEEHVQTQQSIARIQSALRNINAIVLKVAQTRFPDKWLEITPCLVKVYSWVGYDIDGRTDISWGDAIGLRLEEKATQLERYLDAAKRLSKATQSNKALSKLSEQLCLRLEEAWESTKKDLSLFRKDLNDTDNLVEAANHLTRQSDRRLRSTASLYPIMAEMQAATDDKSLQTEIALLRADLRAYGLGTSRIHFRLNSRHVINGIRSAFGLKEGVTDSRTLLMRASELTLKVEKQPVNFASLALEKNTAHQQMILTAQIHKYIDEETPIRLLIAETEDALVPMGMLFLAKQYDLDEHLDISPLFETANALNNGGRIIRKMLSNSVYRDYIEKRGIFAIQTGFSDAGRFMGQVPATLAIERLQSHFAQALADANLNDVEAIIFNTHGESLGRGGHPGSLAERLDYVMSPWAKAQFDKRNLPFIHETSFQGGDGFLWFQTDELALATASSLLLSRHDDTSDAEDDIFYQDNDFSWDVFRSLSIEQDQLYNNTNYGRLLGPFGQNLLIPTGSRAAQRKSGGGSASANPRQLRAIPHNAILQQFGITANIFYGIGRASLIDGDKFMDLLASSARAKSVFGLASTAIARSDIRTLTAYSRLFDAGYWASRASSGQEPMIAQKSIEIANSLIENDWRAGLVDLANVLRLEAFNIPDDVKSLRDNQVNEDCLKILHAIRLAVISKMALIASDLPVYASAGTSRLAVLQKLQNMQIDDVIEGLRSEYPAIGRDLSWTEKLSEEAAGVKRSMSFPHLVETVINPLNRAGQLVRQATIAVSHNYDAFG